MSCTHHQWLPVILATLVPVTFIITYSIAVAMDHVEPVFPFISDTGNFHPESCVFGQFLNTGALLYGIVIYIRFIQVKALVDSLSKTKTVLRRLNIAAFVAGMISTFGISVLGNFQQRSPENIIYTVHVIASGMVFGIGLVYCILQTVISYKVDDGVPESSRHIRRLREVLVVVDFVLSIVFIVTNFVSRSKGPREGVEVYNWTAEDPGYPDHLVSTISEWMVAIVYMLFFATFYADFKHFRVESPRIVYYSTDKSETSIPKTTFNESIPSLLTLSDKSQQEATSMTELLSIHL